MVMQSPIYQEWVREERAEAETKGRMEGRMEKSREIICKYLSRKFGHHSADLQEKVQKISDLQILDRILDELFTAGTIEEARAVILGKIAGDLQ
jgi:predicted transposase YdaD